MARRERAPSRPAGNYARRVEIRNRTPERGTQEVESHPILEHDQGALRGTQRIYSFDDRAAEVYGDMVAAAERTGTPINVADGLIAAIALVHGMSIATRDISGFQAAGAPVVNPWDFTAPLRS